MKNLKQTVSKNGYAHVTLVKNGVRKRKYVHELVAETFLGPKPEGYEIRHKDGDIKNNRVSNLEYVKVERE